MSELDTRQLLVELLRSFYAKGWVSGTGGGICGPADDTGTRLLLAPTGVHKELVEVEDFFVVDTADGHVVEPASNPALRPSECNSIFCLAARERGATSVVHSHALTSVLAGDLAGGADHIAIRDLEMLKGIPGLTNRDTHLVPVIRNTPREPELVEGLTRVLDDPRFASTFAVLVADHGAYIWGDDVMAAKRNAEVYHFLFEATVARRNQHREGAP